MKFWQVQEAKARFSEFLRASLSQGPQGISLRGAATAVLVPFQEWQRLTKTTNASLKSLLLDEISHSEELTVSRGKSKRRNPAHFE